MQAAETHHPALVPPRLPQELLGTQQQAPAALGAHPQQRHSAGETSAHVTLGPDLGAIQASVIYY